jgi:lysophospholipase L1-like esterase
MKSKIKIYGLFITTYVFLLISCNPKIDNPIGTGNLGTLFPEGQAVTYVAIGNSLTAGYTDGALFEDAQQYSYPNLLAKQLKAENFVQPIFSNPGSGTRMFLHGFLSDGTPDIEQTLNPLLNATNYNYSKPFSNLGIPGAVAYDLIDTSDFMNRTIERQNPFYVAILRSSMLGKSVLEQAISLNPNLITMWIGNNDVLGFATSGGTISTTGMPDNPIPTPAIAIQQIIGSALQTIAQKLPNAKVFLFTIPNVLRTPFFNVIPWNGLVLTNQNQVDALNSAYQKAGFTFKLGQNGFVAESPSSPGRLKQLTQDDYVTLICPQDSLKSGWGSITPIPNQYVLDANEVKMVTDAVNDYNQVIKQFELVFPDKVFVIDMNAIFNSMFTNGYSIPGSSSLTTQYISGEMFGLDGIHPSSKGYGVITNEIIKYINSKFHADIPLVNVQNLPAIRVIPTILPSRIKQ